MSDRRVEGYLERSRVSCRFSHKQSSLQAGQNAYRELLRVGVVAQFLGLDHSSQSVGDDTTPARESVAELVPGDIVKLGESAGETAERAAAST